MCNVRNQHIRCGQKGYCRNCNHPLDEAHRRQDRVSFWDEMNKFISGGVGFFFFMVCGRIFDPMLGAICGVFTAIVTYVVVYLIREEVDKDNCMKAIDERNEVMKRKGEKE